MMQNGGMRHDQELERRMKARSRSSPRSSSVRRRLAPSSVCGAQPVRWPVAAASISLAPPGAAPSVKTAAVRAVIAATVVAMSIAAAIVAGAPIDAAAVDAPAIEAGAVDATPVV